MARRPQGTQFKKVQTDTLIKTGPGILYSLFISWSGAAAGNKIMVYDNTSAAGTAIEEIVFSASALSGLEVPMPTVGKQFLTGLYIKILGAGDIVVSVGFD